MTIDKLKYYLHLRQPLERRRAYRAYQRGDTAHQYFALGRADAFLKILDRLQKTGLIVKQEGKQVTYQDIWEELYDLLYTKSHQTNSREREVTYSQVLFLMEALKEEMEDSRE